MPPPIRVIFADDHPVVRRGLVAIVSLEDDIEVVGEAENGEIALNLTRQLKPDVVLMDLQMPVMDGVEATRRIRDEVPDTKVIVLATFNDDDYIFRGISAGAKGYLLKDDSPDDLIEAIRAAHRGESLLNPEVAARLLERFSRFAAESPAPAAPATPAVEAIGAPALPIAKREEEVLALLAQGARNKEIAGALVIAERTVKIHVRNILTKLNVSNRTEAAAVAMKLGLLKGS